jgi:hypothetical protein
MTRVYVPTSLAGLARAQAQGHLEEGDEVKGHAVTPAVREWYVEGDQEELEYSAMVDAAEASLAVLAGEPDTPRRRVVVAADVPEESITPAHDDTARSRVTIRGPVLLSAVVSVHVDEETAAPSVDEAVRALGAARAGDDDAQFLLDEAEALDLLWYDVTEIDDLVD